MAKKKERQQFFPHFYRIFTAPGAIRLGRLILLAVVIGLFTSLIFNIFFPKSSQLTKLKEELLISPFSFQSHFALGDFFRKRGAFLQAVEEFSLVKELAKLNQPVDEKILEKTNAHLHKIQQGPQLLENELNYWQEIVADKPDFRDAYLQMAAIAYQLRRLDEAKAYIDKARKLDPNFEPAKKLEELFICKRTSCKWR